MKFESIQRFDDVIEDEGKILEEYHGFNVLITGGYHAKIYDGEDQICITNDIMNSLWDPEWDGLVRFLWSQGYENIVFLGGSGYSPLHEIRKYKAMPIDGYGKARRQGGMCPKCGIRLFRKETKQCDCGWRKCG
jgi:hypothetical protein